MSRKSNFYMFLFFSATFLFLIAPNVNANPISTINLNYNSSTEELSVTITHIVSNPTTHYVNSVVIKVNGSTVKSEVYYSQPTASTFIYQYANITANDGATIEVTVSCNLSGPNPPVSIIIGDGGQNGEPLIPGYLGLVLVIVASIIFCLPFIYKKSKK